MRKLSFAACFLALSGCVIALAAPAAAPPGDPNAPINEAAFPADTKIKVATLGDSIFLGAGTSPSKGLPNAIPKQLARMLGERYDLKNFSASGRTMLSKGMPLSKEKQFTDALAFKPDVVIIMLGTNDSKTRSWANKAEFVGDYKAFVEKIAALETKPRIFVCLPPWVRKDGLGTINEPGVLEEIPMIDGVAKEMHLGVIDIHGATKDHDSYYAADENVHPNNEGAMAVAKTLYHALTGKDYTGPSTITLPPATAPATAPQ